MMHPVYIVVSVIIFLISATKCEISSETQNKLLSAFIKNLPDHQYTYEDGVLTKVIKEADDIYKVELSVKGINIHDANLINDFKCVGLLLEEVDGRIVLKNGHNCEEQPSASSSASPQTFDEDVEVITETIIQHQPLQLDNEVSTDTAITSGEQFIAIPRDGPDSPCVGCSVYIDKNANGVRELAELGIKHLDKHNPKVKHSLIDVIEVVRQVQVVNGVRFIITILVNNDSCTDENQSCKTKIYCKVSILEKPWIKLVDGAKHRAILANNCTEPWLFGDNGEIVSVNNESNNVDIHNEDIIKVIQNEELQSKPQTERTLSEKDLKDLEDQIIPQHFFDVISEDTILQETSTEGLKEISLQKSESPESSAGKVSVIITEEKKHAIDGLLNFLDEQNGKIRSKRSMAEPSIQHVKHSQRFKRQGTTKHQPGKEAFGGEVEKDPSVPKYKELAVKSLNKYVERTRNLQSLFITKILKVTEQVVSGVKTQIDFQVASNDSNSAASCHSEIWSQPWLNKEEITVNCQNDLQGATINRPKRELAGGNKEADPKDPKYMELAKKSLKKYVESSEITQAVFVEKILRARVQVVSGTLTKIDFRAASQNGDDSYICYSEIWSQPWLNKEEITVNCQNDLQGATINRPKRELAGGNKEVDPKDPKYMELAKKSLKKYVESSEITQAVFVEKILRARVQVVSGTLTKIDFRAASQNGDDSYICYSEIWSQPWLNKEEITVNCQNDLQGATINRPKRELAGGNKEADPKDPKYMELAKKSLKKYVESSEITQAVFVEKILRARVQVVSGTLTKIDFRAASQNGDDSYICYSEIWSQPWLNKEEITVNCQNDLQGATINRPKRDLAGGNKEVDPKDPKYMELAKKSLKKYVESSEITQAVFVEKILRARVQVVSGTLTKIDFRAASQNGDDSYICYSEIWSQPWLNKEEITVNCQNDLQGATINRPKREFPGGNQEADPKDPKYMELAKKSLKKYVESSEITQAVFVKKILRARVQVVSGTLTKIDFRAASQNGDDSYICYSEIWSQPWLNKEEITVNCHVDPQGTRLSRSRRMSGAEWEADPEYPKYMEFAKKSLRKYVTSTNEPHSLHVVKVTRARRRLVNGLLTKIEFEAALKGSMDTYSCFADIWSQPWTDKEDITVDCSKDLQGTALRKKRGSFKTSEVHPSKYPKKVLSETINIKKNKSKDHESYLQDNRTHVIAEEALKHIEAKYPHPRKQKIVQIFSFEKLPIAGLHYRLKVEVGLTNCSALSLQENCVFLKDDELGLNKLCKINVWLATDIPTYRIACDGQDDAATEVYHNIQAERLFYEFLSTHKPSYVNDDSEVTKRFQIFKANIKKIHDFNTHERGTGKYAVTKFADLTYEEFRKKHLGLRPELRDENNIPMRQAEIPNIDLPDSIDWRDKGAVTAVKNQGSCGSCWAFSVTGNVEGQWKLRSGNLLSLSEQELVDCDKLDNGCNGGLPDLAYRAIEQLGGLETESDYPYEGADDKCTFNKTLSRVQISGAVNISSNETEMAKWLVQNGPISIGLNANAMQFYVGGISHPWKILCNPENIDHGVLIVGFGAKDYPLFKKHLPYWTIKNSWGPSWGEQGYYRLYRGDGTCGVNNMASSAIL